MTSPAGSPMHTGDDVSSSDSSMIYDTQDEGARSRDILDTSSDFTTPESTSAIIFSVTPQPSVPARNMSVDESASGESVTASQVMELSAVADDIEAALEGRHVVSSERFGELCGELKRLQDMAELLLQSAVTERTNAETRYNSAVAAHKAALRSRTSCQHAIALLKRMSK